MPTMSALKTALSGNYLKRALLVMLIVGSVLNLINQGDALIHALPINLPKVLLTYLVPFCVATYGASSAIAEAR